MDSAKTTQTLVSAEYDRLLKLDEEQKAKQLEYKQMYKNQKEEEDKCSKQCCGDKETKCGTNCTKPCCEDDDYGSSSDEDAPVKNTSKPKDLDDDGFEIVKK